MLLEHAIHLLHEAAYGTLATHSASLAGYPYATVVPYAPDEAHRPVFYISALAEHTRNLLADARVSLSVLQPGAADIASAHRLTIVGEAERFEPDPAHLARHLRYEPGAERLLALDFMFFRLNPKAIRVIEGVGRMGWLEPADLDAVARLPVEDETALIREAACVAPAGVRLLGIDCLGIDYAIDGRRARRRFAGPPTRPDAMAGAVLHVVPALD